jgi:hypothetical protein
VYEDVMAQEIFYDRMATENDSGYKVEENVFLHIQENEDVDDLLMDVEEVILSGDNNRLFLYQASEASVQDNL